MWSHGVRKNIGKPMKNMMRIALKRDFSWSGQNLTEMAREAWELLGWGIVVPIFEMNQN